MTAINLAACKFHLIPLFCAPFLPCEFRRRVVFVFTCKNKRKLHRTERSLGANVIVLKEKLIFFSVKKDQNRTPTSVRCSIIFRQTMSFDCSPSALRNVKSTAHLAISIRIRRVRCLLTNQIIRRTCFINNFETFDLRRRSFAF